ncbi:MAG TPA: hypothetical protein EYO92_07565, partial [Candidatus Marinimicrobia bacterium]|nr:hypothetical protein [Candidatus Neomarinimicrobiota bacterium]
MLKSACHTLLVFLIVGAAFGQDPPGIRWRKIETLHYRIIFPEELAAEANRAANTVEYTYAKVSASLGSRHRKIPLLLRNRSAVPNAYVSQAPWKSVWYHIPFPAKEIGITEWYQLLALHEGRHMVQYEYLNRGVNRLFKFLGGESMQNMASSFMVPPWFWEGDAVGIETAFTGSGRGRIPVFERDIRANLLQGIRYDYRKTLHGSYRDYTPDHYHYGYLMTTYVRRKYGKDAWPQILAGTMRWPLVRNPFYPFGIAAKKMTGRTIRQLYGDTMDELTQIWARQSNDLQFNSFEVLSSELHDVKTDYDYPGYDKEGNLYALKNGLADVTSLVKLNEDGSEKAIVQIPSHASVFGVQIAAGKVIWTELQPDKRWSQQSWANLVIYDIQSGERRQLTEKVRTYSPALSPDGRKVAAVEFSETRECFLVILHSDSGELLYRYPSAENGTIMFPSWSPDGKEVAFTAHGYNGKAIYIFHVETGGTESVTEELWEDILRPVFYEEYLIYESPFSGIDNLYAVHISTGDRYQITSARVGAYNPTVSKDGNYLIYNDFNRLGNRVVKLLLDPQKWTPLTEVKASDPAYYGPLMGQEGVTEPITPAQIPQEQFDVEDYGGLRAMINFHSWNIFPDETQPEFSITSSNVLGTTSVTGKVTYNRNEERSFSQANAVYLGWYPIIQGGIGWGGRVQPDTVTIQVGPADSAKSHVIHTWTETSFDVQGTIPVINRKVGVNSEALMLSGIVQGVNTTGHMVQVSWPEREDLPDTTLPNRASDGTLFPLTFEARYSLFREGAARDVQSRQGATLNLSLTTTPFESEFRGSR